MGEDSFAECKAERVEELGESLTVVDYQDRKWLIGVQVAAALNRETFNMYRSMKIKGYDLVRATPSQVDWLIKHGVVKSGTHSVTLVPREHGLAFIHSVVTAGPQGTHPLKSKTSSSSSSGSKRAKLNINNFIETHPAPTSAFTPAPTSAFTSSTPAPISTFTPTIIPTAASGIISKTLSSSDDSLASIKRPSSVSPPHQLQLQQQQPFGIQQSSLSTMAMTTPTTETTGGTMTRLRSAPSGFEMDDLADDDSDDFSDDVVQPTKRRRTVGKSSSSSSSAKRMSPRRTRSVESPSYYPSSSSTTGRSPSYNFSIVPALQTAFANARFMPTQATIPVVKEPPSVSTDDDDLSTRRGRRWPGPSSSGKVRNETGPRRPASRRKPASWQVMRAIQTEDCVPFTYIPAEEKKDQHQRRPRSRSGGGSKDAAGDDDQEDSSVAASLLHSLMQATA